VYKIAPNNAAQLAKFIKLLHAIG